jgi:hypothetical protein
MQDNVRHDIAQALEELRTGQARLYANLELLNKTIVRSVAASEKRKLMRALYGKEV